MLAAMLKTALTAMCLLTLSATLYLSASLMILQPPRADYQQWSLVASAIMVQGALTLVALRAASPKALRYVAAAGPRRRYLAGVSVVAGFAGSVFMSLKFNTVLNSMLNSPKFCHR
jgi:hypothetical protein